MSGKKILVCGGRYYPDGIMVDRVLTFLERTWGRFAGVVHGAAGKVDPESGIPWWGADVFAGFWADMHGVPNIPYPYPGEYGKAGGMIRNRWMLERENPDAVVAFPGGNGTRGTWRASPWTPGCPSTPCIRNDPSGSSDVSGTWTSWDSDPRRRTT
jgi:hypothetical protein